MNLFLKWCPFSEKPCCNLKNPDAETEIKQKHECFFPFRGLHFDFEFSNHSMESRVRGAWHFLHPRARFWGVLVDQGLMDGGQRFAIFLGNLNNRVDLMNV